MTVAEIWESKEQHDRWFDENVKPNVPAETTVEEIEVHNIVTPSQRALRHLVSARDGVL